MKGGKLNINNIAGITLKDRESTESGVARSIKYIWLAIIGVILKQETAVGRAFLVFLKENYNSYAEKKSRFDLLTHVDVWLCSRLYSPSYPFVRFLLKDGLGTQCLARSWSCLAVSSHYWRMFESYHINGFDGFPETFPSSASQSMGSSRLCDGC